MPHHDPRNAIRAFKLRNMARSSQQMNSEVSVDSTRLPIGQDVIPTAPDHAGRQVQAAQGRAQVKTLDAVGKQGICHIGLGRAQGRVRPPLHRGACIVLADPFGRGGQTPQPSRQAFW